MTNDGSQDIYEIPSTTPSFKTELAAQLSELIPEAIADGKVDVEKLKELLGDDAGDDRERFGLFWPGKKRALRAAQEPTTATLKPDFESKNWDTTKNVFIEGDNLEVLKILQKHYHGKIKMIYIDPPYNTGKDFVYPDNYKEGLDTYLEWTRQVNEEGKKVSTNSEAEGRYHSNWLNMMYPRLKLARNLLTDDGVISISIDDGEQDNLKKLCNEIFGEENFINTISVNMKNVAGASGGGEDKRLKKNIEYLHIYVRSKASFNGFVNAYDYFPISELVEGYREADKSWKYTSVLVEAGEKNEVGATVDGDGNDIKVFERRNFVIRSIAEIQRAENLSEADAYNKYATKIFQTAMPQSSIRPRVMSFVSENGGIKSDLYSIEYTPRSGRNKGVVYEQFYKGENFRLFAWLRDVAEERDGVLYKKEMRGTYWDYASETKNLTKEGGIEFKNGKKPLAMLRRILEMQPEKDWIALDFFAGSSTTAHAVMQLNAEDGGNRRFIMVQLPEPTPEDSEARKAGFATVADISRKRIILAGEKIKQEAGLLTQDLDIGFRAYKLTDTNFAKWRMTSDIEPDILQQELLAMRDSADDGATPDALLTEILVKQGYSLTERIGDTEVEGLNLKTVGDGIVLAYLDEPNKPTLEQLRKVVEQKPARFVILEDSFQGDDELKTNLAQECKSRGVELWTA